MVNLLVKTLVKGEANKKEYFLLYRRDQNRKLVPFDVTGWTLSIILYDLKKQSYLINGSPVVQDVTIATNACYYQVEAGSTANDGDWLGRIVYTLAGQVGKTKEFQWHVEKVP